MNSMSKRLGSIKTFLQRLLFKPNGVCPICGKVLFLTDSFICEPCNMALTRIAGPVCRYCGRPIDKYNDRDYCNNCAQVSDPVLDGGIIWIYYFEGGKKMVQRLKFGHRPQLGIWMGEQMAEEILVQPFCDTIDAIVPVPLHANRLEERGYNQSECLAQGIGGYLGLPVICDQLQRVIDTPHQIGKNRAERLVNLKNAFDVKNPAAISNKVLLLVDDVNTTGATLRECASVLKRAGARMVYAAASAGVK